MDGPTTHSGAPVRPVPTGNTYDKYGTANPIERRLLGRFLTALDGLLPAPPVGRVLEVGTGEGHVAERVAARFPEAFVTGLDLRDDALAVHWEGRPLAGVFASGDRLPFRSRSFDLVLAVEVLEHVPEPDRVLAEIARVATGAVVLTVPWEPWWRMGNMARGRYLRQFGNTPGHIQHWSARSFRRLVTERLEVTATARSFPWLLVGGRPR